MDNSSKGDWDFLRTLLFFVPGLHHHSVSDMEYAFIVFGVMLVIALSTWPIQGKHLNAEEASIAQVILV